MIFKTTVYLQSFVLHIALGINPKTSGQGHYVQLPFNKQGFQQSLAAQTTNNHYYCKPTPPPPPGQFAPRARLQDHSRSTRFGRAMAQAVSRRLSVEARVRSRVSRCGICGGQSDTATGFPPVNSIPPVLYYMEIRKKKLIIFITGLHNRPQGCGWSVASAAGPFTTKKKVFARRITYVAYSTTMAVTLCYMAFNDWMTVKNGLETKWSWPNLVHYPVFTWRETTKTLSQGSRCPDGNSNPEEPAYKRKTVEM